MKNTIGNKERKEIKKRENEDGKGTQSIEVLNEYVYINMAITISKQYTYSRYIDFSSSSRERYSPRK